MSVTVEQEMKRVWRDIAPIPKELVEMWLDIEEKKNYFGFTMANSDCWYFYRIAVEGLLHSLVYLEGLAASLSPPQEKEAKDE